MIRFVEPCLLFFLSQGSSYGYELMEKLNNFGFPKVNPDPAMVYRTLRYLEKEKFVTSNWDTNGSGPAKRNYDLTEKGIGLLHVWAESIKMRKQVLEKFIKQYKKHFKNNKNILLESST
ncbi:MAG TPA: PadR family transcriptional regulator [Phycisphaerales bacterium]|nr:PadR family transcriptional regulator [Phycisphaerales bacterium]